MQAILKAMDKLKSNGPMHMYGLDMSVMLEQVRVQAEGRSRERKRMTLSAKVMAIV